MYVAMSTSHETTAGYGSHMQFLKKEAAPFVEHHYSIAWFPEKKGIWPAAWYIQQMPGYKGMYYQERGSDSKFPLGKWHIYESSDGAVAMPGRQPAPITELRDSVRNARADEPSSKQPPSDDAADEVAARKKT